MYLSSRNRASFFRILEPFSSRISNLSVIEFFFGYLSVAAFFASPLLPSSGEVIAVSVFSVSASESGM